MKRKSFSKISSMVLSVLLAVTMLSSTAFAQANPNEAKILEENAMQVYLQDDESINIDGAQIDLSNLPDSRELLAGVAPANAIMPFTADEAVSEISNELNDTKEFKLQSGGQQVAADNFNIDVNRVMEQKDVAPSTRNFSGGASARAIGNNSPDTAIYLPPSYFGLSLSNAATNNEDWYYYEATANSRQTILFSQQASGQYAILLYKLNTSTGVLSQVNLSAYSGTSQMIEHLDTAGYYFLRVLPLTPPTTSYSYSFEVYVSYGQDSTEFNDTPETATASTNSVNVNATIDNPYDEDWYKLTMTSTKNLDVTATFAQTGQYAVFLYDSNFNSKGSFLIDGVTRSLSLTTGTYYARVVSYTGNYSDTTKYTLKIAEYVPPYSGTKLASGHYVRLSGNTVYINDVAAQINGTYMSYEYYSYRVSESITNFAPLEYTYGTTALRYTYWTDGVGYRTAPVIALTVTNGYYHCFNNRYGYWSFYVDTDRSRPLFDQTMYVDDGIVIYVDLNTGKVVDCDYSMHYIAPQYYSLTWPALIPW